MKSGGPGVLFFGILGPVVGRRDRVPVPVPGATVRALLALLLSRAKAPVSTDELLDELWRGRPLHDAANSLHVCASKLRKLVGPDVLQTTARGYELVVDPAW